MHARRRYEPAPLYCGVVVWKIGHPEENYIPAVGQAGGRVSRVHLSTSGRPVGRSGRVGTFSRGFRRVVS